MLSEQAILRVSEFICDPESEIEPRHLGVLSLLAIRPMSKEDLSRTWNVNVRTIDRYIFVLKEADLIGCVDGTWSVVVEYLTTNLSLNESDIINQSNILNQDQDQKQDQDQDQKQDQEHVAEVNIAEAAQVLDRPWLSDELGKIVAQELERSCRPCSQDMLVEAVRQTVREKNNSKSRLQRGLQPVGNLLGYFRIVFRNILKYGIAPLPATTKMLVKSKLPADSPRGLMQDEKKKLIRSLYMS